jgi:hypothetical protein
MRLSKQPPSTQTLKNLKKLCSTVLFYPELQEQALDVLLWHLRETPIPPLSPTGVPRSPTTAEEICCSCIPIVVKWARYHADPSTVHPERIALDRLWQWTEHFLETVVFHITSQNWTHACFNAISISLLLLDHDHLVTPRGVQVMLALWLALGNNADLRASVSTLVGNTPLVDTLRLTMRVAQFIMKTCVESDRDTTASQAHRELLEAAQSQIVEVAFRNLDAYSLDVAAVYGNARIWQEAMVDFSLITALHHDYNSVRDRAEIFSSTNARRVIRIISWITDRSPAHWKSASSKTLESLSRIVDQCIFYVQELFLEPHIDVCSKVPRLIHDGLLPALTRARPWLRKEAEYIGSIEERLDSIDRDLRGYMWMWPVYAAMDAQFLSRPDDMNPGIVARLRRWAPAKALFSQYLADGPDLSPHRGPASSKTECSYSHVGNLFVTSY